MARRVSSTRLRAAAPRLPQVPAPFRLTVAAGDAAATERALAALGARWVRIPSARGTLFLLANPRELSAEEHPFVATLAGTLRARGITVRSLSLR